MVNISSSKYDVLPKSGGSDRGEWLGGLCDANYQCEDECCQHDVVAVFKSAAIVGLTSATFAELSSSVPNESVMVGR